MPSGVKTIDVTQLSCPANRAPVTVARATQMERFEIYTSTLQKRLPKFRLPLAPDDRDHVLDLQAVFTRCYDQNGYAARIDYSGRATIALDVRRATARFALHAREMTLDPVELVGPDGPVAVTVEPGQEGLVSLVAPLGEYRTSITP